MRSHLSASYRGLWRRITTKQKHQTYQSSATFCVMGWVMGLEPTNAGTTNQCVNHFATPTIKF
ncbi:exported hypothetical protein [Candidatus Desulfosporosinus infrequens]|uniref:Uncharacterized protein n=1 Tax=Candidatus Desulfosporosinus infrequens TaxID=2043169 RepID=A0A2U3LCW5_9FIRM|nr:exported hypothetical protein [Candidatus Desulfosporosinus infrequens]